MADIVRGGSLFSPVLPDPFIIGGPSWMWKELPVNYQIVGLYAGEDIEPCTPVYIRAATPGTVWKCLAGEASDMHGWSGEFKVKAGQAVTVYKKTCGGRIRYSASGQFTAGQLLYRSAIANGGISLTPSNAGTNDVQTLTNNGDAGTYKLGYGTPGDTGALATSALAFGASAATVQAALELLFGTGNVTVSGSLSAGFVITFVGALAGKFMKLMTFTNSMTYMSGSTTGTIVHTTSGARGSVPIAVARDVNVIEVLDSSPL